MARTNTTTLSGRNLVQCEECHGWVSPKAIICPTCGVPRTPMTESGTKSLAWKIIKIFWAIVLILILIGVFTK